MDHALSKGRSTGLIRVLLWREDPRSFHLQHFKHSRRYLRENPLRVGLVNDEVAYQWSSANPQVGFECDVA